MLAVNFGRVPRWEGFAAVFLGSLPESVCRFILGGIFVCAMEFSSDTDSLRTTFISSLSSVSLTSETTSTNIILGRLLVEELVGILGLFDLRLVTRVAPRVVPRVMPCVVPRAVSDIFLLVLFSRNVKVVGAKDSVARVVGNVDLLCSIEVVEIFPQILSFKNGTLDRYFNISLSPGVASPFIARLKTFSRTLFRKLVAEGRFPNKFQYRQVSI